MQSISCTLSEALSPLLYSGKFPAALQSLHLEGLLQLPSSLLQHPPHARIPCIISCSFLLSPVLSLLESLISIFAFLLFFLFSLNFLFCEYSILLRPALFSLLSPAFQENICRQRL